MARTGRLLLLLLTVLLGPLRAAAMDADEFVGAGFARLDAGDEAAAIRDFAAAVALDPDHVKAHEGLAWAHYNRDEFAAAAREADRRRALTPGDHEWERSWAIIVFADPDRQAEAVAAARQWLRERPADLADRILLGRLLAWAGRSDEARQVLGVALEAAPGNLDALTILTAIARWDHDDEEEAQLLRQALAASPGDRDIAVALERAMADLKRFRIGAFPGEKEQPPPPPPEVDHRGDGFRLLEAHDPAAAAAEFEAALAADPDDAKAHEGLAWAYYALQAFPEAAEEAERRLALIPQDRSWRPHWALIAFADPARHGEVEARARQWAAERPDDDAAQLLLGRVLSWTGDYPGVREVLGALLERRPDDLDALQILASVEQWDQDYAGARDFLRRAAALRPDDPALQARLRALDLEAGRFAAARLEPTLPLVFSLIAFAVLAGQFTRRIGARSYALLFAVAGGLTAAALAWLYAIPID